MLLHHPWIANSNTSTTPTIKSVKKSNSTVLNNYLHKALEKDDTITLDISRSMKLMSPTSPLSHINSPLSPPPIPPPHHLISPIINQHYDLHQQSPTKQQKSPSLFAKKSFASIHQQPRNNNPGLLTRQSMPVLVTNRQDQQNENISLPHVHNLIECSFPKGKGKFIQVCFSYHVY